MNWITQLFTLALEFGVASVGHIGPEQRWRSFSIPSSANMPALMVGDVIVADMGPMPQGPARGDMILFKVPGQGVWVKRVVTFGGERVQMRGGRLVLNGVVVSRVAEGSVTVEDLGETVQLKRYRETLPGGRSYEILKDGDYGSMNDTPEWTVPAGRVFVLGDYRDASADSRVAVPGMVPVSAVAGRPVFIYWARDPRRMLTRVR